MKPKPNRPARLAQVGPVLVVLAVLTASGGCGVTPVDRASCASVHVGDSRLDVDQNLGSAESAEAAPGGFVRVRYRSFQSAPMDACCSVIFDGDAITALVVARPKFQPGCDAPMPEPVGSPQAPGGYY